MKNEKCNFRWVSLVHVSPEGRSSEVAGARKRNDIKLHNKIKNEKWKMKNEIFIEFLSARQPDAEVRTQAGARKRNDKWKIHCAFFGERSEQVRTSAAVNLLQHDEVGCRLFRVPQQISFSLFPFPFYLFFHHTDYTFYTYTFYTFGIFAQNSGEWQVASDKMAAPQEGLFLRSEKLTFCGESMFFTFHFLLKIHCFWWFLSSKCAFDGCRGMVRNVKMALKNEIIC